MVEKITGIVIHFCEVHNVIDVKDEEIYSYGIRLFVLRCMHTVMMTVVGTTLMTIVGIHNPKNQQFSIGGVILMSFVQTVLFVFLYARLRESAGGYHAKSDRICLVMSFMVVILATVLYMIFGIYANITHTHIVTGLSLLLIAVLAPVDDANKPAEEHEIKKYKRDTYKILIFTILIYIISVKSAALSHAIVTSVLVLEVMTLVPGIKNSPRYSKEEK